MRISKKVYNIACRYMTSTYIESVGKSEIIEDLEVLGVTVRPWLDEKTILSIAKVVSDNIVKNGVSK